MPIQDELDRDYRRMVRLFEVYPDPTLFVDKQGIITKVNNATTIFFGYEREDLCGQPVTILMPERFREAHVGHLAKFFSDPQTRPMGVDLNITALKKDGTEEPVTIMLGPLPEEAVAVVRRKRG